MSGGDKLKLMNWLSFAGEGPLAPSDNMRRPMPTTTSDKSTMLKKLRTFLEKFKNHDPRRGWRIGLLSLAFSLLATYAFCLAINFAAWRDFRVLSRISFPLFLLNALIVLIALIIAHALTNRWIFSAGLVAYLSTGLVILDVGKLKMLDIPLVPGDVYLIAQFLDLAPYLIRTKGLELGTLALMFVLSVPLFIWLFRMRWHSGSPRYRLVTGLGGAGLFVMLFVFRVVTDQNNKFDDYFAWTDWDQKVNYEKNGFFFATVANLTTFLNPVREPKNYSQEAVEAIYKKYLPLAASATRGDAGATSGTANVIVYLAEAFWDIDKLGLQLTRDPIPFFHNLEKTTRSGWIDIPTYGGYTAQPEFEIMTGFSMDNLPEMSNPYQSYINLNRRMATLPNVFRDNKYNTYAVHPFLRKFYSRSKAFPLLGFEKFFDINTFRHKKTSGPYISDEMLVDKIVEISEMGSPYFLFSISMSTHGPFDYKDFLNEPLDVLTPMKPESHNQVKTYINAISRADTALKRLIEHFGKQKQKTLIVIFGDHLPMLGDNMGVYRELKYLKSDADIMKVMHSTPIVAWANYPLPATPIPAEAHMLLPYILEAAGIKPTGYAQFMDGMLHFKPGADDTSKTLSRDFEMIQYDILFGKQYALAGDNTAVAGGGLADTIENSHDGEAQSQEMTVKNFGPAEARVGEKFNVQSGGLSAFWFQTENATADSVAMLNETELATTVGDNGKFATAVIPPGILAKPDRYLVYLMDKKSRRKSNEKFFTLRGQGQTPAAVDEKSGPPPVLDWGPRFTAEGEDFNVQADKVSTLWFKLERPVSNVTAFINSRPMPTTIGAQGLISVGVPKEFYLKAGGVTIEIQDNPSQKRSAPIVFKVLAKPASKSTTAAPAAAGSGK